jgi:hypothetical protein
VSANVSEEHTASTFRVEEISSARKQVLAKHLLRVEEISSAKTSNKADGGNMFLRNSSYTQEI